MLEGMDPYQTVTVIVAVIGIIGTLFTSLKARRYLAVITDVMAILSDYYRAIADGNVTDQEAMEIGRRVITLGRSIDEAKDIPAGLK